jgi:hypothetical protein
MNPDVPQRPEGQHLPPPRTPGQYWGRKENQRNRNIPNVRDQRPKGPRHVSKTDQAPPALPKPTRVHEAPTHAAVSHNSPSESSVFSTGISIRESNARLTFNVSAPALIDVSRRMFAELLTDDANLGKVLIPEYLDYYSTAMLWFRLVTLKEKNSQPLTAEEQELITLIQSISFSIPEPLNLYLKSIGNIETSIKQHLYPSFPPLPTVVIDGYGGHYGLLTAPEAAAPNADLVHNLYEEIPCLGVLSYATSQAISDNPPGPYVSLVAYQNTQPTQNLLGFKPLGARRNEAKNLAFSEGITSTTFPSFPAGTGICINFLVSVSHQLANTKTFRLSNVVFSTMPEAGSQAQVVIERPQPQDGDFTPIIALEQRPECLIKEPEATFGSGIFFDFQLFKENAPNGSTISWSLIPNPPRQWIANRNVRRNLPIQYVQPVFSSVSQKADVFRLNVVKNLVTTKR